LNPDHALHGSLGWLMTTRMKRFILESILDRWSIHYKTCFKNNTCT
jgi:hypothetical protein